MSVPAPSTVERRCGHLARAALATTSHVRPCGRYPRLGPLSEGEPLTNREGQRMTEPFERVTAPGERTWHYREPGAHLTLCGRIPLLRSAGRFPTDPCPRCVREADRATEGRS